MRAKTRQRARLQVDKAGERRQKRSICWLDGGSEMLEVDEDSEMLEIDEDPQMLVHKRPKSIPPQAPSDSGKLMVHL